MKENVINLQEFTAKLNKYKSTLHEMDRLTDEEIKRVSSLGMEMAIEGNPLEKQTAIFMHYLVNLFLKELGELVADLPLYTLPEEAFLTKEIKNLEEKTLIKLDQLVKTEESHLMNGLEG